MSILSKMIRITFARSDRKRDRGLEAPPEVERFPDLTYADTDPQQVLDVYRPAGKADLPVIVSVHGGAWVYGDKDLYQYYAMDLARRGFAVVNFSYRLAPEAKFPAQLEDVCLAFRWTAENIGRFGGDKDRLFAVGDSAGAFCLSVYACILTNPALAADFKKYFDPADVELKGVGLNCGLFTTAGVDESLEAYLPEDPCEQAEAIRMLDAVSHITTAFPPAFILTANADFLVDAPAVLTPALEKSGVKYELKVYGTKESPLFHVFHCEIKTEAARHANDDECGFLRGLM